MATKIVDRLAPDYRWNYTLRVQVPNNHILTQNLYYNYYYPKPKYLIIGYMDPLGRNRRDPKWSRDSSIRRVPKKEKGFRV